ncbi:C4-dicarboxylate ABC transporter [Conexibacter sp. JD483]|uniref:SLAC1 family transporter n=1 Tax=unclassified Conexibacter TaxID=2627773 RepID=UPI00271FE479|nr:MULTISPECIES: C4-dicarboxylate ABC transporter [unclassified Conexibacter]MDO8184927.1 C4-dicarboxylate ABC transporter [Conexibacter sp. CPCC 205706]MDO8198071.1 C4-dicarboxylate ABC transporter [Conexibacter sp. CPCC 205762]MDR9371360.1 C4-dicarboxylate ABC transporter [Conexibacter sp. JD483]
MRVAPNWFTAAMGTGIVANAAVLLPLDLPGLHALALAAWVAAVLLLARLLALCFQQWRSGWSLPSVTLASAPFWGAPPMALMTIASGTLLVGRDLLGEDAALAVAAVMWSTGTIGGLVAVWAVPRWLRNHPDSRLDDVYATWLLPVVPPLVSATSGAALIARAPAGPLRTGLLLACCALFALSITAVIATKRLLVRRLRRHGAGPARMVPTLFIALGPLGQSVTAACLLAAVAPVAVGARLAHGIDVFALVFAIPVFALALIWLTVAATVTARTARGPGLPFAATWWSFIFPLGTCVTGSSGLAQRLGAAPLTWIAGLLFAALLAAWVTVAAATARHAYTRRAGATPAPTPA